MRIEINCRENLIKIFKTISWLDEKRWNEINQKEYINYSRDNLSNSQKILIHYSCYITDRQMPFERVWNIGGYIFSEMIYNFTTAPLINSVEDFLSGYFEENKFHINNELFFASRYPNKDFQNILKTLQILNQNYERNIISFIIKIINKFKDKDDLLIRVACALHVLTYSNEEIEACIGILKNDNIFENYLQNFKRSSTENKKRLWCCVRDYKKGVYNTIFTNAIKEIDKNNAQELIDIWNNLPLEQLELPGDVWNNNPVFKKNLFNNIININSIPNSWGMPKIIRNLYNQVRNEQELNEFYPEQFDVTFDFVPRMCNKKLCDVCLFGNIGAENICIQTEGKYCPVALVSCGYISKCNKENCIIKSKISKGLCNHN